METLEGEYPAEIVTRESARAFQDSLKIEPLGIVGEDGGVVIRVNMKNTTDLDLKTRLELDAKGTNWRKGNSAGEMPAGKAGMLELKTKAKGGIFPLPLLSVKAKTGDLGIFEWDFYPTVPLEVSKEPRLIDDFEDGNVTNLCAVYGIGGLAGGRWWAQVDKNGASKINDPWFNEIFIQKVKDGVGGSRRAAHFHGFLGKSEEKKPAWALFFTGLRADWGSVDLNPAVGLEFLAKSPTGSNVAVRVEGTVGGKWVSAGDGFAKRLAPGKEWRKYTIRWNEFQQAETVKPEVRCPALTVDKVMSLCFVILDEGKAFDLWLDDVKLICE